MKVFILLVFFLSFLFADTYDKRNINNLQINKVSIKIKESEDKNKGITVFTNDKKLITYSSEGAKPNVKELIYDYKNNFLAILVGWREIHRGLNINGEYYVLNIFKNENKFIKIDSLTKEGFDGLSEEGETVFLYKTKKNILNYLSNILSDTQKQSNKQKNKNTFDFKCNKD